MATRRPSRPHTFGIRLTAEDEQRLRDRARATGRDVRTATQPPLVRNRFPAQAPPVTVVSAEQAEYADLVACVSDETPSYFADDVHTVCADCGVPIHHRPHAPAKPKKVCLDCAGKATLN